MRDHSTTRSSRNGFLLMLLALLAITATTPLIAQTQLALDRGWRFRAVASAEHPEVLE